MQSQLTKQQSSTFTLISIALNSCFVKLFQPCRRFTSLWLGAVNVEGKVLAALVVDCVAVVVVVLQTGRFQFIRVDKYTGRLFAYVFDHVVIFTVPALSERKIVGN